MNAVLNVLTNSSVKSQPDDDEDTTRSRQSLVQDLMRSNKLSQNKNFYIYWAIIRFMNRVAFEAQRKVASRHLRIMPGMAPVMFEYATLMNGARTSTTHEDVATLKAELIDAYNGAIERGFNTIIAPALQNSQPPDMPAFKSSLVMDPNGVNSRQSKGAERLLKEDLGEDEWHEIEREFVKLGLHNHYNEEGAEKIMAKTRSFFSQHPVKTFTSCYAFSTELKSEVPIDNLTDELGGISNPSSRVVDLIRKQGLDLYPWEICADSRCFEKDGDDAKIDQPTLESLKDEFKFVTNIATGFFGVADFLKDLDTLEASNPQMFLVEDSSHAFSSGKDSFTHQWLHMFGRFIYNGLIHSSYTTPKDFTLFRVDVIKTIEYTALQLEQFASMRLTIDDDSNHDMIRSAIKSAAQSPEQMSQDFANKYDAHVETYVTAFFKHLDGLLTYSAENPYECKVTDGLQRSMKLAVATEPGRREVITQFFNCVKPIANDFIKYAGAVEERRAYDDQYSDNLAQISAYEARGEEVPLSLRDPESGEVIINGNMTYASCVESFEQAISRCKPIMEMIAAVEKRLPEIAKGLDLQKKFQYIEGCATKINEKYAQGDELNDMDYKMLHMKFVFIVRLKNVMLTCVKAYYYVCHDNFKAISQTVLEVSISQFQQDMSIEDMVKSLIANLENIMNQAQSSDAKGETSSPLSKDKPMSTAMIFKCARFSSMLSEFTQSQSNDDEASMAFAQTASAKLGIFVQAILTAYPENKLFIDEEDAEANQAAGGGGAPPKRTVGFMSDD